MDNEKNAKSNFEKEENFGGESATRARNRTVMLTPEITGQVRARLAKELEPGATAVAPGSEPRPSSSFSGSSYTPPQAEVRKAPTERVPAATAQAGSRPGVAWSKITPVVGFLVSFDINPNGEIYELRSGRLIISNEVNPSGNCLVIDDPTVSSMHAIMRITAEGEIQVLDQLSEFGTKLVRFGSTDEKDLSGDKSSLEHGDTIIFGKRKFHLCALSLAKESRA